MCETLQSSVKMLPLALYMIFYALKYYISLKLEEILLVELFPRCGSSLMVHLSFSIFTSA